MQKISPFVKIYLIKAGGIIMKKFFCIAILLMLFPSALFASTIKQFYGVSAEIPDGWELRQGEQVIIYDSSEEYSGGAVVVDCVKDQDSTADAIAQQLAHAVGIEKEKVVRDKEGTLSMEFEQEGEPVKVRVMNVKSDVLMVYSYGENPICSEIASSITPLK